MSQATLGTGAAAATKKVGVTTLTAMVVGSMVEGGVIGVVLLTIGTIAL